jgi:hypothetical protein
MGPSAIRAVSDRGRERKRWGQKLSERDRRDGVDLVMKGGEPQKRSTLTAGEPGSLFRAESSDQPALA